MNFVVLFYESYEVFHRWILYFGWYKKGLKSSDFGFRSKKVFFWSFWLYFTPWIRSTTFPVTIHWVVKSNSRLCFEVINHYNSRLCFEILNHYNSRLCFEIINHYNSRLCFEIINHYNSRSKDYGSEVPEQHTLTSI